MSNFSWNCGTSSADRHGLRFMHPEIKDLRPSGLSRCWSKVLTAKPKILASNTELVQGLRRWDDPPRHLESAI